MKVKKNNKFFLPIVVLCVLVVVLLLVLIVPKISLSPQSKFRTTPLEPEPAGEEELSQGGCSQQFGWNRIFWRDNEMNYLYNGDIKQTSDCGYIVLYSQSGEKLFKFDPTKKDSYKPQYNPGEHDFYLVKLDAEGNKQWGKKYPLIPKKYSRVPTVLQTSDGYVVGSSSWEAHSVTLTKVDSYGEKQWEKSYMTDFDGPYVYYHAGGQTLARSNDGDYALVADVYETHHIDNPNENERFSDKFLIPKMVIIKADSQGNEQWRRYFDLDSGCLLPQKISGDSQTVVSSTQDGGFIVGTGKYIESEGICKKVPYLIKFDTSGNVQWDGVIADFYGNGWVFTTSVQEISDNIYITSGFGCSDDLCQDEDVFSFVIKTSFGSNDWVKIFPHQDNSYFVLNKIQQRQGGYAGVGTNFVRTYDPAGGIGRIGYYYESHPMFIELDQNGEITRQKIYDEVDSDFAIGQRTSDGGYVMTFHIGFRDIEVLKVDSDGNYVRNVPVE